MIDAVVLTSERRSLMRFESMVRGLIGWVHSLPS